MERNSIPRFVRVTRPSRLRLACGWIRRATETVVSLPRRSVLTVYYCMFGFPDGCGHYWSDWIPDETGAVRWCEKCGEIDLV
jgi:hypothetical protein